MLDAQEYNQYTDTESNPFKRGYYKLAVLLTGSPRFVSEGADWWFNKALPFNCDIDYYGHCWDEADEIGKERGEDLIFFVEDDYLHFEPMLEEMISSYERISSQIEKDIFMCPSDYPYLYMTNEKTNILIGNKRHWRTINKSLCTFLTSKNLLDKYWEKLNQNCLDRHDPFEKYINEIYEKEICISPLKSLSLHLTNVNSSYGLSPFINYKKLWDENE